MRIAIVGTGISGLVAANRLSAEHDITVFEARDRLGGHTHTTEVVSNGHPTAVDTGFIVFNEATYPRFCALLRELEVPWQPSSMSFSVRCEDSGLEYNGTDLNGLFAQRSNVLRPAFWRMVRDILRFYRESPATLESNDDSTTLGAYLDEQGYSKLFIEKHLLPMGSAIWSARGDRMRRFPLRFLVQFFHNHGFLEVSKRPEWLVVQGGSSAYLEPLTRPFRNQIRLNTPVLGIQRDPLQGRVLVATDEGAESFDRVVLACHSDQALRLLQDARPVEKDVLGAIGYQRNEAVLHTDTSLMPLRRRAWASWNYHVTQPPSELPTVTYWMNRLQSLDESTQLFVTLNRSAAIAPDHVLRRMVYHHPIYSVEAVRAQARHAEIDGRDGIHFCGAYWGYGFHEDGVKSGLRVVERIKDQAQVSA